MQITAPAHKTIGAAKTQIEPSLIVMNARGAALEGGKLTLNGVLPNSIMFADRPVRAAGHALTAHLLEEWSSNDSSARRPNATVSVELPAEHADLRAIVVRSAETRFERAAF